MRKLLLVFLSVVCVNTAWAQRPTSDILNLMKISVDESSVKSKKGKVYLRVTEVESDEADNQMVFSPDSAYVAEVFNTMQQSIMNEVMSMDSAKLKALASKVSNESNGNLSESDLENEKIRNEFILDIISTLQYKLGFSSVFINLSAKTFLSTTPAKNVTADIILDCNSNTYSYRSISYTMGAEPMVVIKIRESAREIISIDPRGTVKKLMDRYCNK